MRLETIMQYIVAQVAESFGFPRWEVNRMAEQVSSIRLYLSLQYSLFFTFFLGAETFS